MNDALLATAGFLLASASILAIASSIFAIFARRARLKRYLRLVMILSFGSVFYFLGMGQLIEQRSLPVLHAEGIIDTVRISAEGKGQHTNFTIVHGDGATFHLNADGRSDYFRHGQHIVVIYYGYTGTVIEARFFNASGTQEGVFKSGPTFWPYLIVLFGCFIYFFAFKNKRPKPEFVTALATQ
jgi:hypothetical protein